jgi:hypothetical protein
MKRRPSWRVWELILLVSLASCGSQNGPVPRCLTKEEARTQCLAEEISKGFNLDQARLQCDPFFLVDSCY